MQTSARARFAIPARARFAMPTRARFATAALMAAAALACAFALASLVCLAGCSQSQDASEAQQTVKTTTDTTSEDASDSATDAASAEASSSTTDSDLAAYDLDYSKRDLDASYDADEAVFVTLADGATTVTTGAAASDAGVSIIGNTIIITAEGTYVFSGSLTNGQIQVDMDSETKCQLVLDGVTVTNATGPCIYVLQADKVFVTLAEGSTNSLTDGADYVIDEDEEPNATIFSKDDLTLNGSGSLTIMSNYRHGITSKDDLVITGGTYVINAVEDGLHGKDCVKICDGDFTITAGEDAIQSSNDSEEGRGFVAIDGGSFLINAGDDAVHAETLLRITDGTVTIQSCYEGYEGTVVRIDGGDPAITSSDDGINAASPSTSDTAMGDFAPQGGRGGMGGGMAEGGVGISSADCKIIINAGTVMVDADGDGIDSNGSVEVNGGTLLVIGPSSNADGYFDYDSSATINGGTVLMVGTSAMAQNFTSGTQAFGMANINAGKGQTISLLDASGATVASLTCTKQVQVAVVSYAGAAEGDEATITVDSSETALTLSTTASMGMGGLGANGMGRGAGQPGDMGEIGGPGAGGAGAGGPGAGGAGAGGPGGNMGGRQA